MIPFPQIVPGFPVLESGSIDSRMDGLDFRSVCNFTYKDLRMAPDTVMILLIRR
jgi:hypothetical protein